jgi:hypothetical protein
MLFEAIKYIVGGFGRAERGPRPSQRADASHHLQQTAGVLEQTPRHRDPNIKPASQ